MCCGRSSIWLEHRPVTAGVAGSSPVDRANKKRWPRAIFLFCPAGLERGKGLGKRKFSLGRKILKTEGFLGSPAERDDVKCPVDRANKKR